jgi:hypothetical protein
LGARSIVACCWAETLPAAQQIVREAYLLENRLDDYREEDVRFYPDVDALGVGWLADLRAERPGAHIMLGGWESTALLVVEGGHMAGAMQICISASYKQLPVLALIADYSAVSEEVYAASVFLARDKTLLGSIRGQDLFKIFLLGVLIIGLITVNLGSDAILDWMAL